MSHSLPRSQDPMKELLEYARRHPPETDYQPRLKLPVHKPVRESVPKPVAKSANHDKPLKEAKISIRKPNEILRLKIDNPNFDVIQLSEVEEAENAEWEVLPKKDKGENWQVIAKPQVQGGKLRGQLYIRRD